MKIRADQGSFLTYKRWKARCDAVSTVVQESSVEDHHLLGCRERHHALLERIFNKKRHEDLKNQETSTIPKRVNSLSREVISY